MAANEKPKLRPLGFGPKGDRPELKKISGQEKLKIAKWKKRNAAAG